MHIFANNFTHLRYRYALNNLTPTKKLGGCQNKSASVSFPDPFWRALFLKKGSGPARLASNTSIIVSVQINFTASKSTQTVVLNLFYIERLFTNLFLIHFQTKDSDMHAYAHSWSSYTMVPETSQTTSF